MTKPSYEELRIAKHSGSTHSTDSASRTKGENMATENREPLFKFRGLVSFSKAYSVWMGECLETGHIVTADDQETAASMLVELMEDETMFALEKGTLGNLLSNPAKIDVWRSFVNTAPPVTPPAIIYKENGDEATLQIRTARSE